MRPKSPRVAGSNDERERHVNRPSTIDPIKEGQQHCVRLHTAISIVHPARRLLTAQESQQTTGKLTLALRLVVTAMASFKPVFVCCFETRNTTLPLSRIVLYHSRLTEVPSHREVHECTAATRLTACLNSLWPSSTAEAYATQYSRGYVKNPLAAPLTYIFPVLRTNRWQVGHLVNQGVTLDAPIPTTADISKKCFCTCLLVIQTNQQNVNSLEGSKLHYAHNSHWHH